MKLEHKIPPPLLAAIAIALMYGLVPHLPSVSFPANKVLALLVFIVALYFGVSSFLSFRREKTTVNPLAPESASSLVVSGVFKYSRNPMYVSMALTILAAGYYWQTSAVILVLPLWVFYMAKFQIEPEERAMLKLFGEEYEQYSAKVRRWL